MKIAFLGLGAMGSRMVANLLASGHDLTIWNRTPSAAADLVAKGASLAATPRDAASGAEFVIACVRDDDASKAVWLDRQTGALYGLSPEAIAIESSTLTVGCVHALANAFRDAGRTFLDAPVLGSRPQADARALIHVVGGEVEVFERAKPVLASMGAAQHLMGPAGTGAAMKLMVNAMLGIQVTALGELLALTEQTGISRERLVAVFGETPVCSLAAKGASALMLAGNHTPLFPVELIRKDLGYVESEAGSPERIPLTHAALEVFGAAEAAGLSDLNMTAIARLYSEA